MKKTLLLMMMVLMASTSFAKDIKKLVVTTNPIMHCEECETKIKNNLRFEKGVKAIETNVEQQRVTITYDADKTTANKLMAAFAKFGYEAKSPTDAKKCEGKKSCCK